MQDKLDRYKRYIGVCFLGDIDLNKWMVRNGYAVAIEDIPKITLKMKNMLKKTKLVYGQVILFIQKNGESLIKF